MNHFEFQTPIVLIIFNRPDCTSKVFSLIRALQPRELLIIADGPREHRPSDVSKCHETRKVVAKVDWECDVRTNFADENLGCRRRVSSGLDWVFDRVSRAIILEDDCVVEPSFFRFAQELLARYEDDSRVMSIAAMNAQDGVSRTDRSYYFSRYTNCWGWATWRRAWRFFDHEMSHWPHMRDDKSLRSILGGPTEIEPWRRHFDLTYEGKLDSWAFIWQFSIWAQNGLSIIPDRNLVSNIGFGEDATHTTSSVSPNANMSMTPIEFPLSHPETMIRHWRADAYTERRNNGSLSLAGALRHRLRTLKYRAQRVLRAKSRQ
jgi:hypothetical protein